MYELYIQSPTFTFSLQVQFLNHLLYSMEPQKVLLLLVFKTTSMAVCDKLLEHQHKYQNRSQISTNTAVIK